MAALLPVVPLAVPWQASRRGQGFAWWFVLQVVSLDPIYPMILLALLPNREKMRLRDEFAKELDGRLRGAGIAAKSRTRLRDRGER